MDLASGGDDGWMWWLWYGWMWMWWVDVEVFFTLLLFVVAMDLAGGGDGGWMWWPSVLRIVGLRKRETNERERIKNE